MGDPVVVESWHLPRALSDEALRLLTSLPMHEIDRRLRSVTENEAKAPTDEQLDALFFEIVQSGESQSWRTFARAVLARWGAAAPAAEPAPVADEELLRTYGLAKRNHNYEGPIDDWPNRAERAAVVAGLRAVLARYGAAAVDGEAVELPPRPPLMQPPAHLALERYGVTWDESSDKPLLTRMADGYWTPWHVAADLLERQALRPIPVSERLPEKAEMTDDGEVWIEDPGGEYPLGDTGDYDWEPHKWVLGPITKCAIRNNRRWLSAPALPLPEVSHD